MKQKSMRTPGVVDWSGGVFASA